MTAWYNEINGHAADWLENLIARGQIAPGIVDRRSIEDVRPDELMGFTQCHFFAGIGVWSYALRQSGWDDDRPVWTGSCPCQPFSAAGKGTGLDDPRHLWPAWHWLQQHGKRSEIPVLGEQVASADGLAWLDIVQTDMERANHAFWVKDICAAGFGAPNIRQRLFFAGVGNTAGGRQFGGRSGQKVHEPQEIEQSERSGHVGDMADTYGHGCDQGRGCQPATGDDGVIGNGTAGGLVNGIQPGLEGYSGHENDRDQPGRYDPGSYRSIAPASTISPLDDTERYGRGTRGLNNGEHDRHIPDAIGTSSCMENRGRPCPTNGFWADADWIFCRDGKWRPVEPGTFPLVDGAAFRLGSGSAFEGKSRKGMLEGYGNAINAEVAIGWISEVKGMFL